MKKIVVLGGGISGLSTAHFLKKLGYNVLVLDENKVPGGKITTTHFENCYCEMGPNTVLMNTDAMVKILNDYNLFEKVIHPNTAAHKNRFIAVNNKLVKVPVKPVQVLLHPLIGLKNRLKLIRLPFKKFNVDSPDENLESYMTKRFGKDVFRYFVSPFVNGIYAGDPGKILAKYALKIVYQSEQKANGKLFKGMISFMKERKQFRQLHKLPDQLMFTLKGGLGIIGSVIAEGLKEEFISNAKVEKISKINNGFEIEYLQNGNSQKVSSDFLISTIPPDIFLGISNGFDGIESLKVQTFPRYAPVKVFHMAFNKKDIGFNEEGFGVLSLPEDNRTFMGLLFNSSTFPQVSPKNIALFTAFVGGSRQAHLCNIPEDELQVGVISEIKKLLQISSDPDWVNITFWKKGIPQFEKGHESFLQAITQFENENKGLYFGGNYLRAVSVSECAQEGMELAERIHICK